MPGTPLMIWLATPRAMKPAPIIPTRIGRPSASLALRAVSTIITCSISP
jgi:hypothetical protein